MSYLLDKNRIRLAKRRTSHCDQCDRHVTPMDVVSVPSPGRVRCEHCTVLARELDDAPTAKMVRLPVPPPPCGRRMDSTYPPAGPVHTNLQESATAMLTAARESDHKALARIGETFEYCDRVAAKWGTEAEPYV